MVRKAKGCGVNDSRGIESKLLQLKKSCMYEYFHSMLFPFQNTDINTKCHVFKMSTLGPGSGMELVERMRRIGNGDLHKAWVCFDHVKRITNGWTTMATHVYNPS